MDTLYLPGSWLGVVPIELNYIILSKLQIEDTRSFSKILKIKLTPNFYMELLRIKRRDLFDLIKKVITKSYYNYLEDNIYSIVYTDPIRVLDARNGYLPRIGNEYEVFNKITINIYNLIYLHNEYNYLFNNLNALGQMSGMPEVILITLESFRLMPNVMMRNSVHVAKPTGQKLVRYLRTGELEDNLTYGPELTAFFGATNGLSADTDLYDIVILYVLIKLNDREIAVFERGFTEVLISELETEDFHVGQADYLYRNNRSLFSIMIRYIISMKDKIKYV